MQNLIENYKNEKELELVAIRDGFGETIIKVAAKDERVVVLNADLPSSLRLDGFIEAFPERYLQVGVAEQNMASIAAGLSHYGKVPYITSYAAFSPGLNFSQIRIAAIANQNIKIVSSHYGLNVGPDGASAQMESDVAMMKAIPGMTILNPCDYNQAKLLTQEANSIKGPVYLRLTREKFPVFTKSDANVIVGKVQRLLEGDKLTVIATGSMVYEALQAVQLLPSKEAGIDFLNLHTIKPLDAEGILASVEKTKKVVIIEEHNVWGGVGESIARIVSENISALVKVIGIKDTFGESGDYRELWAKHGLDRHSLSKVLASMLKR